MARELLSKFLTPGPMIAVGAGIVAAGALVARRVGVPSLLDVSVSTEEALSFYGILSGIGGAISQIVAGQQMSQFPGDEIGLGRMAFPLAVSIAATAGSAFMLPSG